MVNIIEYCSNIFNPIQILSTFAHFWKYPYCYIYLCKEAKNTKIVGVAVPLLNAFYLETILCATMINIKQRTEVWIVKAWPSPLIGRFSEWELPIGRRRRHVMYGRAGLLIRRGWREGVSLWLLGSVYWLAGLALTSWLAGLLVWETRHLGDRLAISSTLEHIFTIQSAAAWSCGNLVIWSSTIVLPAHRIATLPAPLCVFLP